MYGKIFTSIYDGTLAEDWRALITFQQLIVLCDADGIIDMTPASIARRTGIPIEHIEAGLEILTAPDPHSRSENEQGKRIIPIDDERSWGWQIVNHKHYRDLRTSDDRREYMRNYMRNKRSKQKLTNANESQQLTQLAHTDTDTDTDTIKHTLSPPVNNRVPYQDILNLYHESLSELPQVKALTATRKRYIKTLWADDLPDMKNWTNFFDYVKKSDFLMGRTHPAPGRTKPFVATLEWITKPANFLKILEETYHG